MRKPAWNFVIDSAAFTACLVLVSTGLIMYLVLPPGSGHLQIWGMNRHGWGDIHFWAAIAFITFIVIHLIMHWSWIKCMVSGRDKGSAASKKRMALFTIAILLLATAVSIPFLSPVVDTKAENQEQVMGHPDH